MIPLWFTREIHLGDTGRDVTTLRRMFGYPDGPYDRSIMQKVVGLAKFSKVETGGEVNAEIASIIGPSADDDLTPEWFVRDLQQGDMGPDVRALRVALGFKDDGDDRFEHDLDSAVRRLQSARGLDTTGVVDSDLSKIIR